MSAPALTKIASTKNRRQPRAKCRRENACLVSNKELIDRKRKCDRAGLEPVKGGRNILSPLDHDRRDFQTEHASGSLCLAHFEHGLGIAKVEHDSQSAQLRDKLARELESLTG